MGGGIRSAADGGGARRRRYYGSRSGARREYNIIRGNEMKRARDKTPGLPFVAGRCLSDRGRAAVQWLAGSGGARPAGGGGGGGGIPES